MPRKGDITYTRVKQIWFSTKPILEKICNANHPKRATAYKKRNDLFLKDIITYRNGESFLLSAFEATHIQFFGI